MQYSTILSYCIGYLGKIIVIIVSIVDRKEFIQILKLEKKTKLINPLCQNCKKRMKSKGKNQGFQCLRCKNTSKFKTQQLIRRSLKKQIYLPNVSAHRHLTKPNQRMTQKSKIESFDPKSSWIKEF